MSSTKGLVIVALFVVGGTAAVMAGDDAESETQLPAEAGNATSVDTRLIEEGVAAAAKVVLDAAAMPTGAGAKKEAPSERIPMPEFAGEIQRPTPISHLDHVVEADQSRARLRYLFGLTNEGLNRLNPQLKGRDPRPGEVLRVYEAPRHGKSLSVGRASRGYLIDAVQLPPGAGYKIHYPHRAFGTHYTVEHLINTFELLDRKFPPTHRVLVGDLSFAGGQKITPHVSHRTGRDVDIGYFHKGITEDPYRFENINPQNFDAERNWFMVQTLLDTGDVEFIFMDWRVQLMMRRHALKQGVSEEELDNLFQYPAKGPKPHAVIRHVDGHRDHIHVRFRCQVTDDESCR